MRRTGWAIALSFMLVACETPAPSESPAGGAAAERESAGPARPAPRLSRARTLGPAAQGLVQQARTQAAAGEYSLAAATLERAMRMDPDHPLLWLELARVRLAQRSFAQAEAMARKGLAAAGDSRTQAAAWRMIAAALREQGRDASAIEAQQRAAALDARP
jgi:tetratricopeptide (TPR) repeat protein